MAVSAGRTLRALPSQARLLATTGLAQPNRPMHSRSSGLMEPLEKPWPYKKIQFNYAASLIDGTTKRFKDNSKMVVVEGPPALDKTKFAQELAEEFGMLYMPGFTMEDYYINSYGYDLRELDFAIKFTRNLSYDEKKFAQDPTGQDHALDRMLWQSFQCRFQDYMEGLAHIFNTGQGVVTERSPHSDWVYFEAAFRQGWISRSTRTHYYKMRNVLIDELLRPNLIVYLDAPTDVVQSKIRERAQTTHPWEKDSPVWENSAYVSHLYEDLFKKQYLPTAGISSYVLTYDWSEGGDTEVVVEDIERMEMDHHDKYDKQQLDWRLLVEDNFAQKRQNYSGEQKNRILYGFNSPWHGADDLMLTTEEGIEADKIRARVPGSMFKKGFNQVLGDPEPMLGFLNPANFGSTVMEGHWGVARYDAQPWTADTRDVRHGDKIREAARLAGDADWWKKGWEVWTPHLATPTAAASSH